MKHTALTIIWCLCTMGLSAQQWTGSTTTTGAITRSGNVGIGHVTTIPGFASVYLSGMGGSNPNLMFQNTDAGVNNRVWAVMAQGGMFRILTEADNFGSIQDALIINRSGITITNTLFPNGSVGIGTSTTGAFKLAVEGKIGAREVVVTAANPWPDYVFKPNYRLRPLREVEAFIETNSHLPEVPSAEEVRREGHRLGEMDVVILKKIEELTLYIIDQEKRIAIQNEQIQKLEAELKAIKH